ncbi:hypothetical protein GQX74_003803 [Glossina fuscipes]|nr:hypothetical protein GQX74_003803 [Glossina fuscipes]
MCSTSASFSCWLQMLVPISSLPIAALLIAVAVAVDVAVAVAVAAPVAVTVVVIMINISEYYEWNPMTDISLHFNERQLNNCKDVDIAFTLIIHLIESFFGDLKTIKIHKHLFKNFLQLRSARYGLKE